jgi:hypothetical protein
MESRKPLRRTYFLIKKVSHVPRWFSFGLDQKMNIKKQLKIMKSVTGEAPRMDKATSERRKATWLAWYQGKESGQEYNLSHLLPLLNNFVTNGKPRYQKTTTNQSGLIHIFFDVLR